MNRTPCPKLLPLAASTLLLASNATAAPQVPVEDAGPALDAMRKALGGDKAIAALGNLRMTGKTAIASLAAQGSFVETYGADGKASIRYEYQDFGKGAQGTDGTIAWEINPMAGASIKRGNEAATVLRVFALNRHVDPRKLYTKCSVIGADVLGEVECIKLLMQNAAGEPDRWWLDAKTHLPVRIQFDAENALGGIDKITLDLADWRPVAGVQFPHRRESRMPHIHLVATYESIEAKAELAPSALATPSEVQKLQAEAAALPPERAIEVKLEKLGEQHTATIRTTCKASEIAKNLSVIFPEVMAYLNSIGAKTTGAPFTRYHKASAEEMVLEAGLPVAEPVPAKGRIEPSKLPAGDAATAWHVGPYHELPLTHARVNAWLEANEHAVASPFWEIYMTDPGLEPDPKKWRTQIVIPIRSK